MKLLTARGFSADRGAADVRNRFAIILPVVITVVIIPSQYNSFFSLLPSLLGSLYLVFYPSSVYIPETQLLGGGQVHVYTLVRAILLKTVAVLEAFQPIDAQLT